MRSFCCRRCSFRSRRAPPRFLRSPCGLGRRRGIGGRQLRERGVAGEVAVRVLRGLRFELLRLLQRGVVLRGQVVAEVAVADQVAHLERVGNRRGGLPGRPGAGLFDGLVEVGQHPFLLDGVDAVDQAPFGVTQFEDPAFELQDLLGEALPFAGRGLAKPAAQSLHGVLYRILAQLQLRLLAQQRHVLFVVFQAGDARFDRRLRADPPGYGQQSDGEGQQPAQCVGYLHHFMKNSCINPNISRRPSSIIRALVSLNAAGSAE